MLSAKDVSMVYETLLSSPGMTDAVKIDIRAPRKNMLLLVKAIENGLTLKDQAPKGDLMHTVTSGMIEEMRATMDEILKKSGLSGLYEKLNALHRE